MDIQNLIEELERSIGKIICSKQEKSSEKINIDQMNSIDNF